MAPGDTKNWSPSGPSRIDRLGREAVAAEACVFHQTAIAGDIGRENRGKPPLGALVGQAALSVRLVWHYRPESKVGKRWRSAWKVGTIRRAALETTGGSGSLLCYPPLL